MSYQERYPKSCCIFKFEDLFGTNSDREMSRVIEFLGIKLESKGFPSINGLGKRNSSRGVLTDSITQLIGYKRAVSLVQPVSKKLDYNL